MELHQAPVQVVQTARATSDRGATAVEYALLVAMIAAVVVVAVGTLGGQVLTIFTDYIASW